MLSKDMFVYKEVAINVTLFPADAQNSPFGYVLLAVKHRSAEGRC